MPRLSVNVDHVATLRQARGINQPDPVTAAALAELAGADGIIVHLREDRRHIQDRDVRLLRQTITTSMNLEMAATAEIVNIALELKPDMVTLVPEKRAELTTEGGLDVHHHRDVLAPYIESFKKAGIRVSLFIDADPVQIHAAHKIGADTIEIHTGHYCDAVTQVARQEIFSRIVEAARLGEELKLHVHAGHGLNYQNIKPFLAIPQIREYSIGHSIIAHAVMVGLDRAVKEMIQLIATAGSRPRAALIDV
ncbi:MAG: pyridoxine 5'-phosphate synthase [Deltaproteobacteria bacterium]|nr:pyridoxine 5'-phosphate synthase [Deltaproteobacteria bacterium]